MSGPTQATATLLTVKNPSKAGLQIILEASTPKKIFSKNLIELVVLFGDLISLIVAV